MHTFLQFRLNKSNNSRKVLETSPVKETKSPVKETKSSLSLVQGLVSGMASFGVYVKCYSVIL